MNTLFHRLSTRRTSLRLVSVLTLALTAGACTNTDVAAPVNHDRNLRAAVETVRMTHDISLIGASADGLSDDAREDLILFLLESDARYGDQFFLDAGSAVTDEELAMVRELFAVRALPVGGNGALGPRPSPRSITLYLERHVATVPECGQWEAEPNASIRNNTSSFFGCTHAQSLALMVADPRDLVSGVESARSTEPAVRAILNSRAAARQQGQNTGGATGLTLPNAGAGLGQN